MADQKEKKTRLSVTKADDYRQKVIDYQFNLIVQALEDVLVKQSGHNTNSVAVSTDLVGNPQNILTETIQEIKVAYSKAGWIVDNCVYMNNSFRLGLTRPEPKED